MPGTSRKDIIREGEIATYHIWSQTALQRFLLGRDYGLKQNNEHRRAWCDSLLNHLAKVFVIDVGSFDPMDNHFHLILRSRPDLVPNLTDEEVAFRWRQAWPKYNRDNNAWYRNPTDAEIEKLLMNPDKLLRARANLSSVSWFVGRFKECLSKLANAEVGTKGHFWAERFGSRELVDDPAVCIAMLYTDLNQVRAGMAPSLQESMYATIQARIIENRLKEAQETLEVFHQRDGERLSVTLAQLQDIYLRCSWVAPIDPHGDLKLINDAWNAYMLSKGKSSESSSRPSLIIGDSPETYEIHNRLFPQLTPRASNSPILAMPLEQYLRLAEAAAERAIRLRGSKSSSDSASSTIPDDVAEILRNFGIHCEEWYATLDAFHERFYHIVGSPAHVAEMVARRGKQHAFGINACREVFHDIPATPAEPTEDTEAATPTTCGAAQPGRDTPHDAEFS